MKNAKYSRILLGIYIFLLVFLSSGCYGEDEEIQLKKKANMNEQSNQSNKSQDLPLLEYTMWYWGDSLPDFADENNDAISRVVREKFNIRVKSVYSKQGLTFKSCEPQAS